MKNYKLKIKKCGIGLSLPRRSALAKGAAAIYIFLLFNFSFLIFNFPAIASDPITATITNLYGESEDYISQADYFWNTTLVLTNCIAYAGSSTSSPRQDLTGHTLQLKIGTTTSNIAYTAYASNATNGLWWASIVIPTNWVAPKLQFAVDPTNNPTIYQFKILKAKQPL